jgi:hypothetical protein
VAGALTKGYDDRNVSICWFRQKIGILIEAEMKQAGLDNDSGLLYFFWNPRLFRRLTFQLEIFFFETFFCRKKIEHVFAFE